MTRCHLVGERQGAVGVAEVVEEDSAGDREADGAHAAGRHARTLCRGTTKHYNQNHVENNYLTFK